jgi:hypothetical protein
MRQQQLMQVDVQVYKVQAINSSKTTPLCSPVVNVVNNDDGHLPYQQQLQELYYELLVNQLLQ